MSLIKFKSKRLASEFEDLDPRVQAIALLVVYHMNLKWSYQAVVTSIFRTAKRQRDFYRRKLTRTKSSPHMHNRAIDIRLKDLENKTERVPELLDLINQHFPRNDRFKTALAHGRGPWFHLHIQVPKGR